MLNAKNHHRIYSIYDGSQYIFTVYTRTIYSISERGNFKILSNSSRIKNPGSVTDDLKSRT